MVATASASSANPLQHSKVAQEAAQRGTGKASGNVRSRMWDVQVPIVHSNNPYGRNLRAGVNKVQEDAYRTLHNPVPTESTLFSRGGYRIQ